MIVFFICMIISTISLIAGILSLRHAMTVCPEIKTDISPLNSILPFEPPTQMLVQWVVKNIIIFFTLYQYISLPWYYVIAIYIVIDFIGANMVALLRTMYIAAETEKNPFTIYIKTGEWIYAYSRKFGASPLQCATSTDPTFENVFIYIGAKRQEKLTRGMPII